MGPRPGSRCNVRSCVTQNGFVLTDAQRGHLVSLWILAADRDGEIPDDPEMLKMLCCLKGLPDLDNLILLKAGCHARRQRDVKA